MKKIISTYGLLSGIFDEPWTGTAIHERIDNKLVYCYKQNSRDDIQVIPSFTYELTDGLVTAIELSYNIDNPTPQRLEYFRDTCEYFFELHGFAIDSENMSPRVYFRATDMFDMASLIHALDFLSVSLERIICVVDPEYTEMNAHYDETPMRKRIRMMKKMTCQYSTNTMWVIRRMVKLLQAVATPSMTPNMKCLMALRRLTTLPFFLVVISLSCLFLALFVSLVTLSLEMEVRL